jgi:hypothetical protein
MVQLPGAAMALGAATSIVPAVAAATTAPTIGVRPIRMRLLIPMIRNRSDVRRSAFQMCADQPSDLHEPSGDEKLKRSRASHEPISRVVCEFAGP